MCGSKICEIAKEIWEQVNDTGTADWKDKYKCE